MIPILYQDEQLLVVDKPVGLPVHKNAHMPRDAAYLTKAVGDQVGSWVYNVHRLDAKTSGLVILALSSEVAKVLTQQFAARTVGKTYHSIVKGLPGDGQWDEPVLDRKKGKRVSASTVFSTLATTITDLTSKGQENVPLSLLSLQPSTGRWHQLRQHCAFHRFDIVGDTQHGDWTLNRLVTDATQSQRLLLHASEISFQHPSTGDDVKITTDMPPLFTKVMQHWS